jgi:hypothetical protein
VDFLGDAGERISNLFGGGDEAPDPSAPPEGSATGKQVVEEAQKYLGHVRALFAPERNMVVPPERAAELVLRLCSPEAAVLSGRMISVYDDFDLLLREAERIRAEQRFVLRMRRLD